MKRGLILCIIVLAYTLPSGADDGYGKMFVRKQGDDLYISAKMDDRTDIVYWFRRCMFNELYTFYRVGMTANADPEPTMTPEAEPEAVLNMAYSDNIGPLAIAGHGWCGGNHKYLEQSARTAINESYAVTVDGLHVDGDTAAWVDRACIEVENIILDPSRPYCAADGTDELRDTLCRESVVYMIHGNNIEVSVTHRFLNREPIEIATYYGMQSMFEGETHTFTPGGAYCDWTPQSEVSSFTKGDYPLFRRFVERNATAYQSSFLLPGGLGDHGETDTDDVIFIGNSHGKSYHRLIADKCVEYGDGTSWRGVYTWFCSPLADDAVVLCYEGVIDGRMALFVDCKQACAIKLTLPAHLDIRHCEVTGQYGEICISSGGRRKMNISANGIAGCVLLFMN